MASNWYRFYPDRLSTEILAATSPTEFYRRMKRLALALTREETGVDEWADEMIAEAKAYRNRQSSAGKSSARARNHNATKGQPDANHEATNNQPKGNQTPTKGQPEGQPEGNQAATKSQPYTNTNTNTIYNPEPKPRARAKGEHKQGSTPEQRPISGSDSASESGLKKPTSVSDSDSGDALIAQVRRGFAQAGSGVQAFLADPIEAVWCVAGSALPECAAAYFGDANRERATAGYRKELRRIGESTFRRELDRFIREDRAGEMENVRNKGAAFMARLRSEG